MKRKRVVEKRKAPKLTRVADNVVAEGEATGHSHKLSGQNAVVWKSGSSNRREITAPSGGVLTHQEHKALTLPKGDFSTGIVREQDPITKRARRVID